MVTWHLTMNCLPPNAMSGQHCKNYDVKWGTVPAVTKSGTGTWDLGREDSGTSGRGTRGRGDVGTWGRGDVGLGTWERRGCRDLGRGTRGRDKQTTPDFFAEFVNYNFRCSREFVSSLVADDFQRPWFGLICLLAYATVKAPTGT